MNPEDEEPKNQTPADEPPRDEAAPESAAPQEAAPGPEPNDEPLATFDAPAPEAPIATPRYEAPPEPAHAAEPEPPPRYEEPPPYEPEPEYEPPRRRAAVPEQEEYPFGEPEIPMPQTQRRSDRQRARDARTNLDLDLGRIKRRKRYGFVLTTLTVMFIAFVLAPVTWVGAYLFFDPPTTILMVQRAAEGQTIRHTPVPLSRISPHVVRAVIAAEDGNFCTHHGFDVEAIQRAMEANARSNRVRGGSTISQQTAKNLFLWPARSWVRKGLETYFTALVEFMWPKERIMEAYLNAAEWGDGVFGIEAAAQARFGVAAKDLTPLQAARLAAVLPNPNRWRADNPGPYVRRRSAMLVSRARVVRNEGMAACVLERDRRD